MRLGRIDVGREGLLIRCWVYAEPMDLFVLLRREREQPEVRMQGYVDYCLEFDPDEVEG